jgi:mannose-6-phosphate isomerase
VGRTLAGNPPAGPTRRSDGRRSAELTGDLPTCSRSSRPPAAVAPGPPDHRAGSIDGFARGIYPDDRAKPELLCALTPFDALCGIRPIAQTLTLLGALGADGWRTRCATTASRHDRGLYRGRIDPRPTIVACARSDRPEAGSSPLAKRYPDDPSVVVTLLLNRVTLRPGEALHLTAGNLHAYLSGAGVELMGASDNVVRGGLTEKHVDVDELLRILDPTPLAQPVMANARSHRAVSAPRSRLHARAGRTRPHPHVDRPRTGRHVSTADPLPPARQHPHPRTSRPSSSPTTLTSDERTTRVRSPCLSRWTTRRG